MPRIEGAWVLSSRAVDASGHTVHDIVLSSSGACAPPERGSGQPPPLVLGPKPDQDGLSACFAEIKRLGYRQEVTFQPASRFWAFQWYETGIYTVLALGLAGLCFWWIRRCLS